MIAALLGTLSVARKINPDLPLKVLSVVSGSMEPAIPVGSGVVVLSQPSYFDNDIITFKFSGNLVTHRIIFAGNYFLTKGDANRSIDPETVEKEQIVGKVILHIPYLGYLQESTKHLSGLVLFIIIPSCLIIIHEIIISIKLIKSYRFRFLSRRNSRSS